MPEQIASLFVAIGANLAGLNQGLMQAQGKLKTVGQSMGRLGRTLSMAVTAPLIGIGVAAVKMAANFEQQMGLAQLALRDTGVSMETVEDYADKMGASTIYNALEMASAITGLGKAGLDWEEIAGDMSGTTGVLTAVTSLATASELDLAQAADVVAVAMSTFGRPAEDVVDIVNSLVQSADASVAEVDDLAEALNSAGPVMAGFGYELEDVNIALAILSEGGQRGSIAGRGLRSMFNNLMRPVDKVRDALGLLNVNLYDSAGQLKDMPAIIGELDAALTIGATRTLKMSAATGKQTKELKRLQSRHDSIRNSISDYQMGLKGASWSEEKRREKVAELQGQLVNLERVMGPLIASSQEYTAVTKEMTEELRNELIATLAGTFGQVAMNTLLKGGIEGWEEMAEKIENAATAEEVAAIFTESLLGKIEELQGGVETLAKNFGQALSPAIQEIVEDRLIPLVDVLGELDEEQMVGLAKLGLILAGIGPALMGIAILPKLLGALLSPLGLAAIAVGLLSGAWYMAEDGGIKFRAALRGLSGDLKKKEGLQELGEWIDRFVDLLDALSELGHWIEVQGDKISSFFEKAQPFLGRMIKQEPTAAAIPGMPTTEETWEAYVKEPEIIEGWHELLGVLRDKITEWGQGFFGTWAEGGVLGAEGIDMPVEVPMTFGLAEEAIPDAVEQFEMIEGVLTEKPIELGLTLQPDMDQIEQSGREAGGRWKWAFDSATGGLTSGGGGGGIMDALQAAGIAW